MSLKGRNLSSAVWFSNVSGHQNSLKIHIFIHLAVLGLSCSTQDLSLQPVSLVPWPGIKPVLPELQGTFLIPGLSRKFLEFSIRLLLYICLCPTPKGSEPKYFASHTLYGVFNAGVEKWAEFGNTEEGMQAAERQSSCLSWAVLT